MSGKLENYSKQDERKEKRKAKREKFQKDHPMLSEAILNIGTFIGASLVFAIPYALGRSAKCDEIRVQSRMDGYLNACNDFSKEFNREGIDWIDDDGKYHQDLRFGAYAVWPSCDAYLEAEQNRLKNLSQSYPEE